MLWRKGPGSWPAGARAAVIAFVLVALLGGCVPAPAATPTSVIPAPVAPTPLAATAASTGRATADPTSTATVAPPAAVAQTATPTLATTSIVVQRAYAGIYVVDLHGNAKTLTEDNTPIDLNSIFPPGNMSGNALYLPQGGLPGTALKVTATGVERLASITPPLYGLAASSAKLAWGVADLSTHPIPAQIRTSNLDGTQVTTVYSQNATTVPQVMRVMRWSEDGKRIYFGKEPVGLGGYILFGGLTNLWALDVASGQASELARSRAPNAAICIDDLSADGTLVADHCNGQAMEVIEVSTGITRTIAAPANVPTFAAIGGARFSADGKTLAFAMARRDPDDEQGWVAVADVASSASKLIATSPAKDYFSVVGFLDSDTLLLQSGGQVAAGVWMVDLNGQNLKRVTDGLFLGRLSAQP